MSRTACGILVLSAALALAATGNRRVTNNAQSPSADTSVTLGGTTITIEYNAPSARGRAVDGGLVPHGKVWRLGADAATTMTTTGDITIGNLKVPKGVHTLYVLASENGGWKLIVNKQTGQWGTVYTEGQDLGRVDMQTSKLGQPVEKLEISLKGSGSSGTIEIQWGNTKAVVPVKVG